MNDVSQKQTAISRRQFGKMAGATFGAAAGFYFIPSRAWGRLEKLTLAGIGMGGKGRSDIRNSEKVGFDVIALVDVVNASKLESAKGRLKRVAGTQGAYPQAKFFSDYREMLAAMGDTVDAVTVSIPDHHHFHASALAMQQGKHIYCQKPLTHGIWEARMMARLAEQNGVKTQMGNQAHANSHMRRCVELIRAGIVGKVKAVHAWTNRPIWPQGFEKPPAEQPVPPAIDWEQWIGPAPRVGYSPRIAPFSWRGWWDYGTGALGDMACHIMDMGFWAMDTKAPDSVVAEQSGATAISPPINSKITWKFPAGKYSSTDGFKYCWYDGYVNAHFERDGWRLVKDNNEYNHPGEDVLEGMDFQKYGSVVVGEKGKLFFHRGRREWVVKPDNLADDFQSPEPYIPRAANQNNYQEWMDAIQGTVAEGQSNFQYAASLTETILLGVLAQRVPDTELEWDAEKMGIKGRPELKKYIQRPYRDGWQWEA